MSELPDLQAQFHSEVREEREGFEAVASGFERFLLLRYKESVWKSSYELSIINDESSPQVEVHFMASLTMEREEVLL